MSIYVELDDAFWETRKVEVFRDGSLGFADQQNHSKLTELSISQYPPLEEIAADSEFEVQSITRDAFAAIWSRIVF